jgi:hypothetical protein
LVVCGGRRKPAGVKAALVGCQMQRKPSVAASPVLLEVSS